jgi:hypothetical protein
MEGKGIFYWIDGDKYEGTWKDNQRDGTGQLTTKEGEVTSKKYSLGVEVKKDL